MKLGISGINGRVGKHLYEIARNDNLFSSVIGFLRNADSKVDAEITQDLEYFCKSADIIIDFSSPELLMQLCKINMQYKKPIVSGTTGLCEEHFEVLKDLAKVTKVCWSGNMSQGVALLKKLIHLTTQALPNADIEILETHHNLKKDSPSGTALSLGEEVVKARGMKPEALKEFIKIDRNGVRQKQDIGFAVRRGGNVIGEHSISFYFGNEIIELEHRATDRSIFAQGAIDAATKLLLLKQANGYFEYVDLL